MRWLPLLLLALIPRFASAWQADGVRLTRAMDSQVGPVIASDGDGGAFVSWADFRDFGPLNSGSDLYLQRVTALGQIAPGWPLDGVLVAGGPGTQGNSWRMCPDRTGGVLIVYGDTRLDFGDLYLQRITAAGGIAPGWPVGGVAISVSPDEQYLPELIADGEGGAFVSWQDGSDPATTRARFTHVLAGGEIASGWPVEGRLFEPTSLFVLRPLMLANAITGGFLACWSTSDDTLASVRLMAQRFTQEGIPDTDWPADGVTVCEQRPFHRIPREHLVPDGTGGFYTLFADARNSRGAEDLYAQHVLGSGVLAPGWPADGQPVSAQAGVTEQDGFLCEDGAGGVFFAWEDYRSNYARIFGQHLGPDGQPRPGWPTLGLSLSDAFAYQLSPELAWDGRTGAYLTWNNLESTYKSYVQHLTAAGTPAPGWPASGLPVSTVPDPTRQYVPVITADGRGGAIVAWEDIRDGETDVYAQRFVDDGVVATQVSLASAEATPEEVRIRWHVSGESRASVERRESDGLWEIMAQVEADGSGYVSLVDREVTAGTTYSYRLAFANGTRAGEISLQVPTGFALNLEGARPNPATGPLLIAFTLPDAKPARLELYDLSGRRVAARALTSGAGQHVMRLDREGLAPGLYWAALSHGGRTLRSRVVLSR